MPTPAPVLTLRCQEPAVVLSVGKGQVLRVGRDKRADLCIADVSVGRQQAILRHTAAGVTIEDAGSPTGTFVNGLSIKQPTLLQAGDEVRLGGLRFSVDR